MTLAGRRTILEGSGRGLEGTKRERNMNKLYIPIFLLALLTLLGACSFGAAVRDTAVNQGGKAFDEALITALAVKCKGASIGSIERRYMQTQETWELWYKECLGAGPRIIPELPKGPEPEPEVPQ